MSIPHRTGFRAGLPALFLLAACSALGAQPDSSRCLLLWGGIDADGAPFLEPVFVMDAPPALPRSIGEHVLIGRTGDGAVLFSLPFEMPVVADGDGSSSFVFMLPVEPGWEGGLASVTLTGPGGSDTLDEDSHRPMAILRDSRTGRIHGILRDLPPTVMTQAIADTAVLRTPLQEVLFSRGIPGPGAWRRRRRPAPSRPGHKRIVAAPVWARGVEPPGFRTTRRAGRARRPSARSH